MRDERDGRQKTAPETQADTETQRRTQHASKAKQGPDGNTGTGQHTGMLESHWD
jgi:hypothetical protein